jgi:methylenetetrahydrofolate dehydrogenase (NADP+) / methenyltetrahydrofolate cyclohydrolase
MPALIDGKQIARDMRDEIASEVRSLGNEGIQPRLSVVLVGEDPASQVYVRNKNKDCESVGIVSESILLPASISEEELLERVRSLNEDRRIHGILVQLPLPKHIREGRVIQSIDPSKDVDGFHPVNVGKLMTGSGEDGFIPCTPAGVIELLMRSGHPPQGRHAVIVGRSNIVGKPLSVLLLRKGKAADATVTVCHTKTGDLAEITRTADILIAAAGQPEIIRRDMVKSGVVVIDVGMNRMPDPCVPGQFRFVGDVHFDGVSEKAAAITPVPGGVGPMTRAFLLKNTLKACHQLERSKTG